MLKVLGLISRIRRGKRYYDVPIHDKGGCLTVDLSYDPDIAPLAQTIGFVPDLGTIDNNRLNRDVSRGTSEGPRTFGSPPDSMSRRKVFGLLHSIAVKRG